VHIAPACVGSVEGFDYFGSNVRNIFLHFCKRFSGLELMTSWSQVGMKILTVSEPNTVLFRPFLKYSEFFWNQIKNDFGLVGNGIGNGLR
jgi:hypothetical protein